MLKEFLDFNTHCPSCKKPLTLFMRWSGGAGDPIGDDYKLFQFYLNKKQNLAFQEIKQNNKFFQNTKTMEINGILYPDTNSITFNTSSAEKIIQNQDYVYFFFLCNPDAIEHLSYDYEIDAYKACYFRSSFPVKFSKNNNLLSPSYLEVYPHLLCDESFTLIDKKEHQENIYVLTLSYEDDQTLLKHYSVTNEQAAQEDFEPVVFSKEFPLLKIRPDPSDKEKILKRLNGWIIMS